MGSTFPRSARVRRRREYLRIQSSARRVHTAHYVILLSRRTDDGPARLGLVTSRKVANAVGRNRVRRLLREVFRCSPESFPRGYDVVVIARQGAAELAIPTVRGEILAALAKRRP